MYQIALCDDSPIILEQFQHMLKLFPEGPNLLIKPFLKGAELENALRSGQRFDLIILDVELGEMSGVRIAEFLRNRLQERFTPVLYISANQEHSMELFETRPLHFLVKPIQPEKLHQCLLDAVATYAASKDYFDCVMDKAHRRILCCVIQYFESQNKKILIHTTDGTLSCYGKLAVIKDRLPRGFIMIHKSYLVNQSFITGRTRSSVTLADGLVLPISRHYRESVYIALLDWALL